MGLKGSKMLEMMKKCVYFIIFEPLIMSYSWSNRKNPKNNCGFATIIF